MSWKRYSDLLRRTREGKSKGEDVRGLERKMREEGSIVERFLGCHCGCDKCLDEDETMT